MQLSIFVVVGAYYNKQLPFVLFVADELLKLPHFPIKVVYFERRFFIRSKSLLSMNTVEISVTSKILATGSKHLRFYLILVLEESTLFQDRYRKFEAKCLVTKKIQLSSLEQGYYDYSFKTLMASLSVYSINTEVNKL